MFPGSQARREQGGHDDRRAQAPRAAGSDGKGLQERQVDRKKGPEDCHSQDGQGGVIREYTFRGMPNRPGEQDQARTLASPSSATALRIVDAFCVSRRTRQSIALNMIT
jgi:hypothetical protein